MGIGIGYFDLEFSGMSEGIIEKLTGMDIVDNLTFRWFGPGLYCSMLGPQKRCQDWITEEFKNELNKKQEQNK